MLRTALWLLQRCNHAPFVFHSMEMRTLALIPADGSSCKALKIRYCRVPLPFVRLFVCSVEDCNVPFVLFFLKASVRFPSRHRRSLFVFCFPKNMERSVTLHILRQDRTFVLICHPIIQSTYIPKIQITYLLIIRCSISPYGNGFPWF